VKRGGDRNDFVFTYGSDKINGVKEEVLECSLAASEFGKFR